MVKKTLHVLEKAGWIERVSKGTYVCVRANEIFNSMIEFKVPNLLREASMRYAYADASAVEVWTDYSYIQRSWEHSPYYVKILQGDLRKWVEYFRMHKVRVFVDDAEPSLGEFVVLKPQERVADDEHNGLPVEPLNAVVKYCEKRIDALEFPLAYLKIKFGIKTEAEIDKRVMKEAAKAI
jgi:hypothetical protein